ncbi:3-keto-5-aminohexanoate cleavage protein [Umezawaea sp.]|uniref:3-keto-5-aminohexanoate cleavage protein n=1 Tax=Umezawaea sp. TaxID=1955258 RepID=UPI002ED46FF6
MRAAERVIISAAITGSVHVPSQSDHLPITPEEVVAESLAAAEAGAAVIHLHARHAADGRPAFEPEVFEEIIPPIAAGCDAVVNITTGGASSMTIEERLAAAVRFSPELASLNMGSMNFVYSGIADRVTTWKHAWEKPYVENTYRTPFVNSFEQIEHALRELGERGGTRFEYECYDIGHLYTLAHFADRGLAKPPFLVQGVFGILGGIGADHANLTHMVAIADKLFGADYHFSAFAAGRQQMEFCTHSAWLGGHVRVGLEDNLYIGKGEKATGNSQQVRKVRDVLTGLGREIATPADVRRMLGLKGAQHTTTQRSREVPT